MVAARETGRGSTQQSAKVFHSPVLCFGTSKDVDDIGYAPTYDCWYTCAMSIADRFDTLSKQVIQAKPDREERHPVLLMVKGAAGQARLLIRIQLLMAREAGWLVIWVQSMKSGRCLEG